MKHKFILLVVFVATVLVGCKPKDIDVNNTLKQISEETFAKTPSRSYVEMNGTDMLVVEYSFDAVAKTAIRKEVNFAQKALYSGMQTEKFTYSWGEFNNGMYGRSLLLTGGNANRILTYLNDQLNDGKTVTSISEPRADMAANMIDGLVGGMWAAEDPTYVLQYKWVDTVVYEYTMKGKKIVCDTIYKRMPRPNYFDTIGVDSCFYYTYTFKNEANGKPATLNTDFQANVVVADTTLLKQIQNPSKYDTIITYTVSEGSKVFRSKVDYAYWAIGAISVVGDAQNMDVMVAETGKDPITLPITNYLYNGAEGSFDMNNMTFIFKPKN